jgi:hypothetical protein
MPKKQQMVATEQESVQAKKEDTTQLYIGMNIIVKGMVHLIVHRLVGLSVRYIVHKLVGWVESS